MAPSDRDYSDNDIDLPPNSTLSVTLCVRGRASDDSPKAWGPSPPSGYTFTPCPPIPIIESTQPIVGILADFFKPLDDETPTFEFGERMAHKPRPQQSAHVEVEAQSEARAECDVQGPAISVQPRKDSRHCEYNAATMADFQRHLSVIDCPPSIFVPSPNIPAPSHPFDHILQPPGSGNTALQDYQIQLMLLEQHKKRQLMLGTPEASQKADSLPSHSFPATGNTSSSMNPKATVLQQQMEIIQGTPVCHLVNAYNERFREQNKHGFMQNSTSPRSISRDLSEAEYQMQLMLLEQQNKRRLMEARKQSDRTRA